MIHISELHHFSTFQLCAMTPNDFVVFSVSSILT